jgi:hypothetical protein
MMARLWLPALLLAGCSMVSGIPVENPNLLETRMRPEDVEALVLGRIQAMELQAHGVLRPARVISMKVLRPEAVGMESSMGPIWEVKAEGTFTHEGPPTDGKVVGPSPTGTFLIRDLDGGILRVDFP